MSEKKKGVTVKDVDPVEFIATLAAHFKKSGKIELPEWHDLVKTGAYKEICPTDPDWYYVRAGMPTLFALHLRSSLPSQRPWLAVCT